MLALVVGIVAAPFAQAHAMRLAAVGADMCKVGTASQPSAPAPHQHVSHGAACECCAGSAPGALAVALAVVVGLRVDTTFVVPVAASFVPLAFHIERAAQPRAPPILA